MLNSLMYHRAPSSRAPGSPQKSEVTLPWDKSPGVLDSSSLTILARAREVEGESRVSAAQQFQHNPGVQPDLDHAPDKVVRFSDDKAVAMTAHRDPETKAVTYFSRVDHETGASRVVTWSEGKFEEFTAENPATGFSAHGKRNENGTITILLEQE